MVSLKGKRYFFIAAFLAVTFSAFAAVSPGIKFLVFLMGVLLPCGFLLRRTGPASSFPYPPNHRERVPSIPVWIPAAAALFGLFERFYKLTALRHWLSSDEALQGFFAIDLLHQWSWRFFYTTGQHPPMLIWLLKFFFQFFKSPFFNLWFLPAVLSALFAFLGYLAARLFFPKTISTIYGCLLATAFWPLFYGRFCVQGGLVPAFEAAVFLALGGMFKGRSGRVKAFSAAGLGLLLGVGTWTYTSWAAVVLFVVCVFVYGFLKRRISRASFFSFLACLLAGALPWLMAVFREKFGGYLMGVSMLGGFFDWKEQLLTSVSYFTTLFWGSLREPVSYGPSIGGMLNPFLGACFFLGVAELYRLRKGWPVKALGPAFILFLLPGVLSADHVEMFRLIQLMPVLLLVAAAGVAAFLEFFKPNRRKWVFVLLLVLSSLFDFYHLMAATSQPSSLSSAKARPTVQDENYWAYEQLKPVAQKLGPGLIFTDFILLTHNHTLHVATYPFNALENAACDPAQARWAAVVTNIHYAPFLLRRFPGSQWRPITPYPTEDGGSVVGLIPVTSRNQAVLLGWIPVHQYFHRLGIEAENMMNNQADYQNAVQNLPSGYPLLKSDPFLESCYGEWAAQYHEGPGLDWNIQAVRRALQKGYPTANLYYKLGSFYFWNHEPEKARQAYLLAARCRPNYTNAKEVLARLWGERK